VDFRLTEEQKMIRDMVREFAREEIAPVAAIYDESGEFPMDIVRKMAELNLLGLVIPEQYGGAGTDTVSYALAIEEVSRYDASMGLTIAAHNSLCTYHMFMAGNEEQRKKYVVPLARGEMLGAWALTEPNSGSDAASLSTTAVRDGNEWVLNGQKMFITHASVAGVTVVMANTDKDKGTHGVSAFIVEAGTPGFKPVKLTKKMGMRASDTSEIYLEDCRIPAENLLGKEGEGFIDTMKILDGGRISIAAFALGIARGAYEESVKYAREREQFNKPIGQFQAVQWMLADMATSIEAARLLTLRASCWKDQGRTVNKESAMAKLFAGETATTACRMGVQIHGGYGMMKEYPVERYYRDVKLGEIGEGTSEIQRLIISRNILKHGIAYL